MQDKNIQFLKCIQVFLCYYTDTVSSDLLNFLSMWVCTMQMVEDIAKFGFEKNKKYSKQFFDQVTNFVFYNGLDAEATCQWFPRNF